MSEVKEYVIENVGDFLKIPTDKIEQCLHEFRTTVRLVHAFQDLSQENVPFDLKLPKWIWVDDGKHEQRCEAEVITISLTDDDGELKPLPDDWDGY